MEELENFIFSDEVIENSPSKRDNVDPEIEEKLRVYGCELIQEAGILLRMPQVTMATGQVLFHRFYYLNSFKKYNVKEMAFACIFLASKLEETAKKLRECLMVFNHMLLLRSQQVPKPLDIGSQKYWDMKNQLIKMERQILKDMGFRVFVEHPYKYLVNYLKILKAESNTVLGQTAWNYLNDSYRTNICVRFKTPVIASACIYMSARVLQVPLPEDPPWWELFGATKEQMDAIAWTITRLYVLPKAEYISLEINQRNKEDERSTETQQTMFVDVSNVSITYKSQDVTSVTNTVSMSLDSESSKEAQRSRKRRHEKSRHISTSSSSRRSSVESSRRSHGHNKHRRRSYGHDRERRS